MHPIYHYKLLIYKGFYPLKARLVEVFDRNGLHLIAAFKAII